DEKFQRKCFDYIEGLRAAGCAILIVTHSTSTVEKFCQRAALLHRGELHALGPAKEVIDQYHALLYSDEKTYLRYLNASQPQQAATDAESASPAEQPEQAAEDGDARDRKSTRLNSSHVKISYAVFCLKKEKYSI